MADKLLKKAGAENSSIGFANTFVKDSLDIIQMCQESNASVDAFLNTKIMKLSNDEKKEVLLLISSELVELNEQVLRRDRLETVKAFLEPNDSAQSSSFPRFPPHGSLKRKCYAGKACQDKRNGKCKYYHSEDEEEDKPEESSKAAGLFSSLFGK
jgi:hypothetical protein